jgi:polar amino acid transport system substrate-binding protein
MRARALSLLPLLAAGCVLAGCGGSGGSSSGGSHSPTSGLAKPGVLTTCTHLPYPPFEFEQNGKVVGFDVDLVDKAARKLGAKQTFLDTPFENFKTGAFLNTGQCDVAAAGITITPERRKYVDFSDPYFDATQALVVRKGSDIPNLAGAKGKKIGTQTQTTGEEFATSRGLNPTSFESSDALLNGLRTGQVDGVITDYPVVAGWLKQPKLASEFEVKETLDTHEQYGFMVRKGNTKVLDALNAAIKESKADGSYKAIYEKWIGPFRPKSTAGTTPSGTTTSK